MIKNKKIICLIIARAGSRGLKNKNILPLGGKPLVYWTIQSAKKSKYIDHIMISTDSKKIIQIAKKNNIDIPFIRPRSLSQSHSSVYDVIFHAKKYFSKIQEFDYLILLQATSPFRTFKHIDKAIKKFTTLSKTNQNTLVSVKEVSKKMHYLMKKNNKNFLEKINNKSAKFVNRQGMNKNLNNLYLPNGAIFICNLKKFNNNFYSKKTLSFVMDKISSIDIDEKNDFEYAKKYVSYLR